MLAWMMLKIKYIQGMYSGETSRFKTCDAEQFLSIICMMNQILHKDRPPHFNIFIAIYSNPST